MGRLLNKVMFAKQCTKEFSRDGRLYIIEFVTAEKETVYKIGMTYSPRSVDRMMEILRSWFMQYRYVPEAKLRLDFATGVPLLFEQHIHEMLKDHKWIPDKKVDGGQEMFKNICVDTVKDYVKNIDHWKLIEGKDKVKEEDMAYILKKCKKDKLDLDEDVPF